MVAPVFLFVFTSTLIYVVRVADTNGENNKVSLEDRMRFLEEQYHILEEKNVKLQKTVLLVEDKRARLEDEIKEEKDARQALQNQTDNFIAGYEINLTHRDRRQVSELPEVAFFACVFQNIQHTGIGQVIVFDKVVTNIDNTGSVGGYSGATGVFTAPVDGLYVFTTTIMAMQHDGFYTVIHKDTIPLLTMWINGAAGGGYNTASSTVVVTLRRGETVTVREMNGNKRIEGVYLGGGQSTFAGFLLLEHNPSSVVVG